MNAPHPPSSLIFWFLNFCTGPHLWAVIPPPPPRSMVVTLQDVTNKRTLMHAFADWCQRSHKELLTVSDEFPDVEEVGCGISTPFLSFTFLLMFTLVASDVVSAY